MIIVTGGAGFIGANLIRALNARGHKDILVVDDLTEGTKFTNLVGCEILDYMDKQAFLQGIQQPNFFAATTQAVFHQGACSVTTEWNGKYMMENNYSYSKILLQFCLSKQIPFIYASSAAVYGGSATFKESKEFEIPLNVYGYSKFLFDQHVRSLGKQSSQIVGLRYFNVYGPHEQHKGSMASVAFHLDQQIKKTGKVQLFAGSDGYADGEQRRDFVYVDDVVNINLWFLENSDKSGIFNVGTGKSQPFNDVARAILTWHGKGQIEYIPFPKNLEGRYQSFTQADLTQLRAVGYVQNFLTVEQGINRYLDALNTPKGS